jgi:hypothetical protein
MIGLVGGGPLVIEELDLSGIGLYLDSQVDTKDPDVFLTQYTSMGRTLYQKKSDEGKKRHTFEDKEIVLWKDVGKEKP